MVLVIQTGLKVEYFTKQRRRGRENMLVDENEHRQESQMKKNRRKHRTMNGLVRTLSISAASSSSMAAAISFANSSSSSLKSKRLIGAFDALDL